MLTRSLVVSSLVSLLLACSSPAPTTDAADSSLDAITDAADTPAPDTADVPADVQWPACTVPAPHLGTSPEATALAAAPARCGEASYTWLADPTLGHIVARGPHVSYSLATLRVIANVASTRVSAMERYAVEGDVVEYVTQDHGRLVNATAIVLRPAATSTATTYDVVLFTHGTSGFNDACAPSADPGSGAVLPAILAGMGYVVVAPDYIGMRSIDRPSNLVHPYLVGEPTAIASLDSVRAALRFMADEHGPICASQHFATFGGSQGGHAALWVDRLAPYYLSELTHVGVAATVPPADLTGEITPALQTFGNPTPNSAAFLALAAQWYGIRSRLNEVFVSPFDTQAPDALATSCSLGSMGIHDLTAFQPTLLQAATENRLGTFDPWGCILRENSLTTTSITRLAPAWPGYGVMFVLGGADELVNTPVERVSFQTLCSQGMAMQYLECQGAMHVQTSFWSFEEILAFLTARFAGTPMTNACPTTLAGTRCSGTP